MTLTDFPGDPARNIAKMLSKLDDEDKQTFNALIHQAALGQRYADTLADPPACVEHNRELIYCGTCVANRDRRRAAEGFATKEPR